MTRRHLTAVVLAALAAAGIAGCGESDAGNRGNEAVGLCQGHGGVVALEDEIVICRDQTSHTAD